MLTGIMWNLYLFLCLQAAMIGIMLIEFYRMIWPRRHLAQQITGILSGFALLLAVAKVISCFYLVLPFIAMFVIQLYRKDEQPFLIIAQNVLAMFYIALPVSLLSYFVGNTAENFNGNILLACFIILWSNDVGAYIIGIIFGRHGKHKLFPSVSPKKSWEGFAGGFCTSLFTGYLMSLYMLPFGLYHCLAIAMLISIFGVLGDLTESQLKRSVDVKNSGRIMPGHGGLLDRFDASLFALPVALCYMKITSLL
jgi:phosphatidate cytidylyltransferase